MARAFGLAVLALVFLVGCEDAATRHRRELHYPIDMKLEAVLINQDADWTVTMWQGEGDPPKNADLKPGARRTELVPLHFDRPFEIRQLKFSARAHGKVVADQVLQVRPGDKNRIGVVFQRTPENAPTIFWLTNP